MTTSYGLMAYTTHKVCKLNTKKSIGKFISVLMLQLLLLGQFTASANNTQLSSWGDEEEVKPDPDEESKIKKYYNIMIKAKELGNYMMILESHEVPSHETIPIVGKEYFGTSTARFITEVDNNQPSARYDIQTVKKVDIWYNNSHYDQTEILRQNLDSMVAQLRSSYNLDVQFNQIDTYEDKEIIEKYKVKYIKKVGSGNMGVDGEDSEVSKKYLEGGIRQVTVKIPAVREDKLDAVQIGVTMFHSVELDENGRWVPTNPENLGDYTGFAGWHLKVRGDNTGPIGEYINDGMNSSVDTVQVKFYKKGDEELMTVTIGDKSYEDVQIQGLYVTVDNITDGDTPPGQMGAGIQAAVGSWADEIRTRVVIIQVPTLLCTALTQMTWRPEAIKFVIYANHDEAKAYRNGLEYNADFNKEVQQLTQTGAYYIGVCSSKNSSDFYRAYNILRTLKPYDSASAMYTNAENNLSSSVSSIKNYILSKIPNSEQNKKWILLDSAVNWSTTYDDYEGDAPLNVLAHASDNKFMSDHGMTITSRYTDDAILAERWRFRHNKEIYDNNMGMISTNDLWVVTPITTFNKVGLYRINYKRKDNPFYPDVNKTYAFDNYRYWSTDYDSKVEKVS